jgi:hypothetical protein
MPCPSHPPWLDHSNYTWWRVQVMKLSPTSHHFISLWSKYSLQHPVLKHNLCSSLNVRDQISHPYRTTGKIIILYTLILCFSEGLWQRSIHYINTCRILFIAPVIFTIFTNRQEVAECIHTLTQQPLWGWIMFEVFQWPTDLSHTYKDFYSRFIVVLS